MLSPKQKGDLAVGQAISYFVSSGYEVCLPIGDKRDYDFLVEKNYEIDRVQVKYAGYDKRKNRCLVALRTKGGNQSFHTTKKYKDNSFDILFVHTSKRNSYVLPWSNVKARSELAIDSPKWLEFRVK